jgi:hypothetical protein
MAVADFYPYTLNTMPDSYPDDERLRILILARGWIMDQCSDCPSLVYSENQRRLERESGYLVTGLSKLIKELTPLFEDANA